MCEGSLANRIAMGRHKALLLLLLLLHSWMTLDYGLRPHLECPLEVVSDLLHLAAYRGSSGNQRVQHILQQLVISTNRRRV